MVGPYRQKDLDLALEIAKRLRDARKLRGLSMREAADAIGVEPPRYRTWEQSMGPIPAGKYLATAARILGIEVEWLASGTGAMLVEGWLPLPLNKALPEDLKTDPAPSHEDRSKLASRMLTRRTSLNLSRNDVSIRSGVSHSILAIWEKLLPVHIKPTDQEALEKTLLVPAGWLMDLSIETPSLPSKQNKLDVRPTTAGTCAEEIIATGAWLSRELFFDRVTDIRLLSETEARNAEIFAARYGVQGEDCVTLEAIGEKYGMTRERVRQIVGKMMSRATELNLLTTHIERAAEEISDLLPSRVGDIDEAIRPILGGRLSLLSLDRFGREVVGRSVATITPNQSESSSPFDAVVINPNDHSADMARHIRDSARRMIRSCGAAQLFYVAGAAGKLRGEAVSPEEAERGVRLVPGFAWISEEHGWFWFGEDKESRVISAVKKMLSATDNPIDIEELHAGACRARRMSYDEPKPDSYLVEMPIHIMREMLKKVSWLRCTQHDDFRLQAPLPKEDALSESEQAFARVVREKGGVVSRNTLQSLLVPSGEVPTPTLNFTIASSPIVRLVDRGVYAIRGSAIPPEPFAAALNETGG